MKTLIKISMVAAIAALGLGCSEVETTDVQNEGSVAAAEQALTEEQCDYFDVNGSVQICHELGNGSFKILRVNEQGCINAHSDHGADYVTSTDPASPLYDPTCNGQGCLPVAAPCDETLPCCEGSACVNGVCEAVNTATCPCTDDGGYAAAVALFAETTVSCHTDYVFGSRSDLYVVAGFNQGRCAAGADYLYTGPHGFHYSNVLTEEETAACRADLRALLANAGGLCPNF